MKNTLLPLQQQHLVGYFALGELLEENELGCIGMGIESGIDNTNELKVLGFNEAMAFPDEASVD